MARFHRWLIGSHLKDGQTSQVIEGSIGGLWGSRTCKVSGTDVTKSVTAYKAVITELMISEIPNLSTDVAKLRPIGKK